MLKKSVRAILIINHDKVLMGKKAKNEFAGLWTLPGGKEKINESSKDAIIRETHEELGIKFYPTFWKNEVAQKFVDNYSWEITYFWGTFTGDLIPKIDEISEIMFISKKDLDTIEIGYDHKKVLLDYFALKN